ncbi:MAG TPA: type II secretion system protein [Kiritimatiellia bacterium]|nr:type II secretion system protein [Kiritimatiellia bacterium]HPS07395.1 type II secretion system protein [Kiritimatiellia bacterium]
MNKTRQQGMTVAELMVSMALLLIIMMAALPLVDQMIARFQMARDHYVATTICQGRIERARASPYLDLGLLAEKGLLVDDFGNPSSPGGRFRRSTVVLKDTPAEGLTTMTVRTDICICSRWGWRKVFHPIKTGSYLCRFTDEHEKMTFLFTDYLE